MNVTTRFAAAALFAAGFGASAHAEEWTGPRVVGTGENASVVYSQPSQNVVGGALTRSMGSGESVTTSVISVQNAQAPGGIAQVVGSGENLSVIYLDAAQAKRLAETGQAG